MQVRERYEQLEVLSEQLEISETTVLLQQAHLDAGIVSRKWEADALHVAVATAAECRLIVSWNFRHIVNFQKIPLYNAINVGRGFGTIAIHSPREVIENEDQDI